MEKRYKIKKDVRGYFGESAQKEVGTLKFWKESYTVGIEILEEVPRVYIKSGITNNNGDSTSIKGWGSSPKEGRFDFSVVVQDMEHKEYESTKLPEIMDEIQKVLNRFFTY